MMGAIDSQAILHNAGNYDGSDEHKTPSYGVLPIIKYIKPNSSVWCPFDQEHSHFVQMIRAAGHTVIASHIDEDKNFFTFEPKEHWDMIISNPPFKRKRAYFERTLSFNKPFALLMSLAPMNDRNPAWCFVEAGKELQLLKFDKRIHFENKYGETNTKTTFQSAYWCSDLLPSNLIQEALEIR